MILLLGKGGTEGLLRQYKTLLENQGLKVATALNTAVVLTLYQTPGVQKRMYLVQADGLVRQGEVQKVGETLQIVGTSQPMEIWEILKSILEPTTAEALCS